MRMKKSAWRTAIRVIDFEIEHREREVKKIEAEIVGLSQRIHERSFRKRFRRAWQCLTVDLP